MGFHLRRGSRTGRHRASLLCDAIKGWSRTRSKRKKVDATSSLQSISRTNSSMRSVRFASEALPARRWELTFGGAVPGRFTGASSSGTFVRGGCPLPAKEGRSRTISRGGDVKQRQDSAPPGRAPETTATALDSAVRLSVPEVLCVTRCLAGTRTLPRSTVALERPQKGHVLFRGLSQHPRVLVPWRLERS